MRSARHTGTDWSRRNIDDLDSLRYHALANAVTVPVAEWLASRIKAYLLIFCLVRRMREGAALRQGRDSEQKGKQFQRTIGHAEVV
jgi:hypothetical protein